MSPKEYSNLKDAFMVKLAERLKADGYTFEPRIVHKTNHSYLILLLNEVYELFCDGESASWDFRGVAK